MPSGLAFYVLLVFVLHGVTANDSDEEEEQLSIAQLESRYSTTTGMRLKWRYFVWYHTASTDEQFSAYFTAFTMMWSVGIGSALFFARTMLRAEQRELREAAKRRRQAKRMEERKRAEARYPLRTNS